MSEAISDLTNMSGTASVDRSADFIEVSDSTGPTSYKATPNFILGFSGGDPVSTSDTQTLTNKTLTSPTASNPVLSGTITGTYTIGGTPTFPSAVVTLTGTQTLTNKTLTSPTINTATIVNPTLTVDTVSEFTSTNGVAVDGVTLKDGGGTFTADTSIAGDLTVEGIKLGDITSMTAGTGITTGSGTVYTSRVYQLGNVVKTEIFIDLTGLNSSAAADIIGVNSASSCHLGQVTTALNGTVYQGQISCIEVPATGEPDIDVYSANESTGTEDADITTLTETALQQAGADYTSVGIPKAFTAVPPANDYLYLVGSGGGTSATYTAGQFLIELWGYKA